MCPARCRHLAAFGAGVEPASMPPWIGPRVLRIPQGRRLRPDDFRLGISPLVSAHQGAFRHPQRAAVRAALRTCLPWFGGTLIANALRGCKDRLARTKEGDRAIILITDGGSGDFGGGRDRQIAQELADAKIRVFTILIGNDMFGTDGIYTIAAVTARQGVPGRGPGRAELRLPRNRPDAEGEVQAGHRRLGGLLPAAVPGRARALPACGV